MFRQTYLVELKISVPASIGVVAILLIKMLT